MIGHLEHLTEAKCPIQKWTAFLKNIVSKPKITKTSNIPLSTVHISKDLENLETSQGTRPTVYIGFSSGPLVALH